MKTCFHCGEEYREVWRAGKIQPLNAKDDRPHWATCKAKAPNQLRTRAARGFRKQAAMFAKPVSQFRTKSTPAIERPGFKPSCGECGTPPWEVCACSMPCAADATQPHSEGVADLFNLSADERLRLALEAA